MRLRARLILAAAYLLVVVVVSLEIPLAVTISRQAQSDLESRLVSIAAVVAARINDDLPPAGATSGPPNPPAVIGQIVADAARTTSARIVVTDALGRVLADSSDQAAVGTDYATPDRPEFRSVFAIRGGRIDVRRRFSASLGQELLLATAPVVHQREVIGAVRISESLGQVNARVHRTWFGLGLIGLAVILVGLGLAWFLAAALARPVDRLAGAAARLGRGDLEARADPKGPREVTKLAQTFNQMAVALSSNIRAQRDFLANASHQLRTPLTGLKLRLEAIEQEGGPTAGQAAKARAEVDRLSELVDDLLELARAASTSPAGERVELAHLAHEAVDRWTAQAERDGKSIVERIEGSSPAWASRQDLSHVLDNLIENSIRYTPAGTKIEVGASSENGASILSVSDTGPGIGPEDQDRLFERFYRGTAGKRAGPGTGLGLAVVAQLVDRWGGKVHLAPGPGTIIRATFPMPPTVS